ncbi:MAG: hypothetical protein R3C14_20465 [Caldilineaceae bacterium]
MCTKLSLWIIAILMGAFAIFSLNATAVLAQEEDGTVAQQVFVLRNRGEGRSAQAQPCAVTVELRWYKKKQVRVLYQWQGCTDSYAVRWALASVRNADGNFTIESENGEKQVYKDTWPELAVGDELTLHTWINDQQQADVVTQYQEASPIWVRIHTRSDSGGACFQFTGHVDPWGVFTAGDQQYVFSLDTKDWETPWVAGPNQPTVDWHVQFYQDEALTKLRTEYWFNNVENPCYIPPAVCTGVTLSIADGAQIPDSGADIQVTINGRHGEQYQVVDEQGQVVAGPSTDNRLTLHAMPKVRYQGQVYSSVHGWTNRGCNFQYKEAPQPLCQSVGLSTPVDQPIVVGGIDVEATIAAENASHYRIIDSANNIVAGPATTDRFNLHVIPRVDYQAQVYNENYGWTNQDCDFHYLVVLEAASCKSIELTVPDGALIPAAGVAVEATVGAKNASQYQIVNIHGSTVAGPSTENHLNFLAQPLIRYEAQVYDPTTATWIAGAQACQFRYEKEPPLPVFCSSITLSLPNGSNIPESGADVEVTITGQSVTQYRIVDQQGTVITGPSVDHRLTIHALPNRIYQAQVADDANIWSTVGCQFQYGESLRPACQQVTLSIATGSAIPTDGADVEVTVTGQNGTQYRIVKGDGTVVAGLNITPVFQIHALPDVHYQAQVFNAEYGWSNSGCDFGYTTKKISAASCTSVTATIPDGAKIPASGANVEVTIKGQSATQYRIMQGDTILAGPSANATLAIHAMPNVGYEAQVYNDAAGWSIGGCAFQYEREAEQVQVAQCSLNAGHYGDPGGRARITAWVEGQTEPVAIEKIDINWNDRGDVTYPTKRQRGPWFTNAIIELVSRPEVDDIGFGHYKFDAWVYIANVATPAYCEGIGFAPDHDNVVPDPGPFAKDNPEGKFSRSDTPSRLPVVGRLPFDGGNGPDKIELILWAFEKEGRGVDAKITAIANEGKPLARLGMESVSNFVKFDGLPAREGIVYGFQIGEHGPWSPLFCPKSDNNPTTITVYWGAGGQTWLSDGAAYGDCWWLTVAAALNGWVTVDEDVATYNALQGVINWNGHQNLVFSLAQSKTTGLGPRMQDVAIGLHGRQWQGPIIPENVPTDFTQVVANYHKTH